MKNEHGDGCARFSFCFDILAYAQKNGLFVRRYAMGQTLLFYYTLIVLLICIMTAAGCCSTFLISRKKIVAYAAIGFTVYFFDVALIFQHAFLTNNTAIESTALYNINAPAFSVITGAGVLGAFWFCVCEYINEQRNTVRYLPIVLFVISSIGAYVFIPAGGTRQFVFYSMREVTLAGGLIYLGVRFITDKNEQSRARLARHAKLYAWVWLCCIAIVVENVIFQLLLHNALESESFPFLPDRNFAENILILGCALWAGRYTYNILILHYKNPPTHSEEPLQDYIHSNLSEYCARYDLSSREGEVLALILQGKDNQNIAHDLSLALSTVKVHVHNVLKKTDLKNRQDLIKDFWEKV